MTTINLSYIEYYPAIRRAKNFEWQRNSETSTSNLHNIKEYKKYLTSVQKFRMQKQETTI